MTCKCQPLKMASVSLLLMIAGSASKAFSQQGIITTIAGGGTPSALALSADLGGVTVAVDPTGTVFLVDSGGRVVKIDPAGPLAVDTCDNLFIACGNNVTRRVDAVTGIITTVRAGGCASALAVDALDNLFIADCYDIVRLEAMTGITATVAGNGKYGYSGDGGTAVSASLAWSRGWRWTHRPGS